MDILDQLERVYIANDKQREDKQIEILSKFIFRLKVIRNYTRIDYIIIEFLKRDFDFWLHMAFLIATRYIMDELKCRNILFYRAIQIKTNVPEVAIETLEQFKGDDYGLWLDLLERRKKISKINKNF